MREKCKSENCIFNEFEFLKILFENCALNFFRIFSRIVL